MKSRTFFFAMSIILTLFTYDGGFKHYFNFSPATLSITRLFLGLVMGSMLARFDSMERKKKTEIEIISECENITVVAVAQAELDAMKKWAADPNLGKESRKYFIEKIDEFKNRLDKTISDLVKN